MKEILITGGAGFIGYHLAKHLLSDPNNRIVLADNLQRGRLDADLKKLIESNTEHLSLITADLTDKDFYSTLDKHFDHIYHLAAINGTKNFYSMPEEVLRINTLSLIYLLEWASNRTGVKPKVCFTSSNEAYAGALESYGTLPLPTPENVPLIVSDTYNPRWTYGATKLIGELFMIHYAQKFGFPAVIVRPHNFYGPRAGYDHVIPEFCQRILKKEDPFAILGSDETRSFCYITDAVEAMQRLMDSPATEGYPIQTVHIGSTEETNIRQLAETLFEVTGWQPNEMVSKESLPGSVKRRLPDVTKIEKLIGWKAATPLKQGLKETFDWYAANPKN
ncbi:MAG: GDP-mannose 4,6-dehydratase [Patescibacteria group bacterium]